ncbi:LysE family transporter [Streptomyces sp. CA-250714]|uniref:LysE family transporter n=1 Tax=Streptomyces sp. CA-250714 TaxID=3240060 RepID=UPI003D8DFC00
MTHSLVLSANAGAAPAASSVSDAVVAGLVAGYAVAIPVGALAVLLVSLTARTSLRVGAAGALGVATADGAYATVAVLGGAAVAHAVAPIATPLRWTASAVLVLMAARSAHTAVRALRETRTARLPEPQPAATGGGTADRIVDGPSRGSDTRSSDRPDGLPGDRLHDRPCNPAGERSPDRSDGRLRDRPCDQPRGLSRDRPGDRPRSRSGDRLRDRPRDQPCGPAGERSGDGPPGDRPGDRSRNQLCGPAATESARSLLPGDAALGTPSRAYLGLLGLTLLNPWAIIYFSALTLGNQRLGGTDGLSRAAFVAGIVFASVTWQLLLASGGAALGRALTGPRGRAVTGLASSAIIAALAVALAAGAGP